MIDVTKQYRTRSGLPIAELRPAPFNNVAGMFKDKRLIFTQWNRDTGKCVVLGCEEYDLIEVEMTDDLVKRLRNPKGDSGSDFNATYWVGLVTEAADRIEALEQALHEIASNNFLHLTWHSTAPMPMERYKENCEAMVKIARAALGEKKDGI